LVMYHASWNPTCDFLQPVFGELSSRYTTPLLRFGSVDLDRFPQAAELATVDTGATACQVPSFVLYNSEGREVKRLPPVSATGTATRTKIDREGLLAYFDLQQRLVQSFVRQKGRNGDERKAKEEERGEVGGIDAASEETME
jgi:thiol-disulfide isomerase/thioredoxin